MSHHTYTSTELKRTANVDQQQRKQAPALPEPWHPTGQVLELQKGHHNWMVIIEMSARSASDNERSLVRQRAAEMRGAIREEIEALASITNLSFTGHSHHIELHTSATKGPDLHTTDHTNVHVKGEGAHQAYYVLSGQSAFARKIERLVLDLDGWLGKNIKMQATHHVTYRDFDERLLGSTKQLSAF